MRLASLVAILLLLIGLAGPAAAAEDSTDFTARFEALRTNADGLSDASRLHALFDTSWDYAMHEYPEFATFTGYPGHNDRWTDQSLAAIERRRREARRPLEVLATIDRSELDPTDQLNYDLFKELVEENVAGLRFPDHLLPINQMNGVQQGAPQMLTVMPTFNRAQYDDILSRLEGLPTVIDQNIVLLGKGLEEGITPPRIILRDVAQQIQNQIVDEPLESPLLLAFNRFPESLPEADQEKLRERAVEIFTQQIRPAFERLHTYWVETYYPATRESIAFTELPDGEAWYAFNVAQFTSTDLEPRKIHEIGLGEVERIRREMDQIIESTGFEGDFNAFTEFLRTDPQFYFEQPEDLIATYRDIAKRADAELVKLFSKLPRLPYGVEPVPAYAEKSQTTAYYEPGSIEAGRPGIFRANTYDLKSRPKWEMEALTLHEAVPGHHLQIALSTELDNVPTFRRFSLETAFVEGWGLYSESLGEEMGFYQDPYAKFGQLTYEIWRAIRLVVDTGMHALGWSREQAIEYFRDNTGRADHDIVVEVDRYIAWPGQALAYKIGELKLKELRAHAEAELGEAFDIRAFHDQVLGSGALPLNVLEARLNTWTAEQKQELTEMAAAP